MFFRGRQPESKIWRRFRSGFDGFTFGKEDDGAGGRSHYTARVAANAERVVDLFHSLTLHLPPAIDVAIEEVRGGQSWRGWGIALPDVRDAIGRLKVPLATYGGVELSVYTDEDQLTLDPQLELYIYARTDQWYYILRGKGLEEQREIPSRSWRLSREQFAPAPELSAALDEAVSRLALVTA